MKLGNVLVMHTLIQSNDLPLGDRREGGRPVGPASLQPPSSFQQAESCSCKGTQSGKKKITAKNLA